MRKVIYLTMSFICTLGTFLALPGPSLAQLPETRVDTRYINRKALVEELSQESFAEYLNRRNARIEQAFDYLYRFRAETPGIQISDNFISVNGEMRPDLIPIERAILLMAGGLSEPWNGDRRESLVSQLLEKGMPLADLAQIERLFAEEMDLSKATQRMALEELAKGPLAFLTNPTEQELRDTEDAVIGEYLNDFHAAKEAARTAWTLDLFNRLTLHGRRVLLSLLFEKYADGNSVHFREFSSDEAIQSFRSEVTISGSFMRLQ